MITGTLSMRPSWKMNWAGRPKKLSPPASEKPFPGTWRTNGGGASCAKRSTAENVLVCSLKPRIGDKDVEKNREWTRIHANNSVGLRSCVAAIRHDSTDRGRDDGIKVAPPSEPDRRFSRIRLSRRLGLPVRLRVASVMIGCGAIGPLLELRSG